MNQMVTVTGPGWDLPLLSSTANDRVGSDEHTPLGHPRLLMQAMYAFGDTIRLMTPAQLMRMTLSIHNPLLACHQAGAHPGTHAPEPGEQDTDCQDAQVDVDLELGR
jgi:hypothetical protein